MPINSIPKLTYIHLLIKAFQDLNAGIFLALINEIEVMNVNIK